MAERTYIPTSPACGRWETLLADALDGELRPEDEAQFTSHMATCTSCGALFDEARRGREWLEFLAEEPEAPADLVDRILARTGQGHKAEPAYAAAGVTAIPAWQRPGFIGQVRRFAEPRLMMTAAMAFFSIALTLNLAGVRITEVRASDLRPSVMRSYVERRVNMASVPLVRYYDHLRFVYEVETRMRELKSRGEEALPEQSAPGQTSPAPGESRHNPKGGGSKVDPPQQSAEPAADPYLVETALEPSLKTRAFGRLQNSTADNGERSTRWTA